MTSVCWLCYPVGAWLDVQLSCGGENQSLFDLLINTTMFWIKPTTMCSIFTSVQNIKIFIISSVLLQELLTVIIKAVLKLLSTHSWRFYLDNKRPINKTCNKMCDKIGGKYEVLEEVSKFLVSARFSCYFFSIYTIHCCFALEVKPQSSSSSHRQGKKIIINKKKKKK